MARKLKCFKKHLKTNLAEKLDFYFIRSTKEKSIFRSPYFWSLKGTKVESWETSVCNFSCTVCIIAWVIVLTTSIAGFQFVAFVAAWKIGHNRWWWWARQWLYNTWSLHCYSQRQGSERTKENPSKTVNLPLVMKWGAE